jgi:hypothetical protein
MISNNVPTYLEKEVEPFTKLLEIKQFHKSSYTIPKESSKKNIMNEPK